MNKTNLYKPGTGLSLDIIKLIKPMYLDLIKESELKKCLHHNPQNQTESFNSVVWQRAPKTSYCSFDKLEFAVYDAAANFKWTTSFY